MRIAVKQGKDGKWRWTYFDEDGIARAAYAFRGGSARGHATQEEAEWEAREAARGMGRLVGMVGRWMGMGAEACFATGLVIGAVLPIVLWYALELLP